MTLAELGKRIRYFRKLRRLTQAMLGRVLHVSRQAVAKYERGRAAFSALRVPALCKALQITPNELFGSPMRSRRASHHRRG